jgi:hypothetical protein
MPRPGGRTQHEEQLEDGFRMLQVGLQLDPEYSDAMAYMNLLYRIQAGIADTEAQSAEFVAKADDWVKKALAARRREMRIPQPAAGVLDVDGPAPGPWAAPLLLRRHPLAIGSLPTWRAGRKSSSAPIPGTSPRRVR